MPAVSWLYYNAFGGPQNFYLEQDKAGEYIFDHGAGSSNSKDSADVEIKPTDERPIT